MADIIILFQDKEWHLPAEESLSVRKALEQVGLGPEYVITMREGQILTLEAILTSGDVIRIMPMVSGG